MSQTATCRFEVIFSPASKHESPMEGSIVRCKTRHQVEARHAVPDFRPHGFEQQQTFRVALQIEHRHTETGHSMKFPYRALDRRALSRRTLLAAGALPAIT